MIQLSISTLCAIQLRNHTILLLDGINHILPQIRFTTAERLWGDACLFKSIVHIVLFIQSGRLFKVWLNLLTLFVRSWIMATWLKRTHASAMFVPFIGPKGWIIPFEGDPKLVKTANEFRRQVLGNVVSVTGWIATAQREGSIAEIGP